MLKNLFEPTTKDICPNCGQACATTDILCPRCGKNLDELFEQLPDIDVPPFTLIKFIKGLFVILVGILIPFASATLAVSILLTYGSIHDSGRFVPWHSLGSPQEKVSRILGFCDGVICVQTDNQKTYKPGVHGCDGSSPSCWEQVEQPIIEKPYFGSCWFNFTEKTPPQRVIQVIKTNQCGSGGAIQTDYALLADGNVWVWTHTVTDLEGLGWFILAFPVAIIAFIVGVVLAFIYTPRIWKKNGY
jgi:hypothetical protein